MRKADDGLRPMFHERLRQFHWQAIETGGVGLGVPDSNYCGDALEGWVEFKSTRRSGSSVDIRPEQVAWCFRRWRAGGRVTIAVRHRHDGGPRVGPAVDQLHLVSGRYARELLSGGISETHLMLYAGYPQLCPTMRGGPARWDWAMIARCLQRDQRLD
jgi:hypothetical protein